MFRWIKYILLLIVSTNLAYSADLEFRIHLGQGAFAMSDIHKLQNGVLNELRDMSIAAKILSDFPDFYYTRIEAINRFSPGYAGGLTWMHMETGGKIHYEDYSGEILSEQIVICDGIGLYNSWTIVEYDRLKARFNMPINALWSKIVLEDESRIYNETTNSSYELVALGLGIDPAISLTHDISKFHVSLEVGYQFTFSKPFHLKDNSDAILRVDGSEVSPDWSGFRLGISVGYKLRKSVLHQKTG